MPTTSCIELRDWHLPARIGTYGPADTVPEFHALDLTLWISPQKVLIDEDGMAHVFDYDPLVAQIERMAAEGRYETQERLITRIVECCVADTAIEAVDVTLRKFPVRAGSGLLGVRLTVDGQQLAEIRQRRQPSQTG
jgi:dihydroneopterin aldolase